MGYRKPAPFALRRAGFVPVLWGGRRALTSLAYRTDTGYLSCGKECRWYDRCSAAVRAGDPVACEDFFDWEVASMIQEEDLLKEGKK